MRTNVRTVTKSYDTATINGWEVQFEYESENNLRPVEIRVTGTKDAGNVYVSKTENNCSVNFGGGAALDSTLIKSVNTEIEAIEATFAKAPEPSNK